MLALLIWIFLPTILVFFGVSIYYAYRSLKSKMQVSAAKPTKAKHKEEESKMAKKEIYDDDARRLVLAGAEN